jgi:hypothetical protein
MFEKFEVPMAVDYGYYCLVGCDNLQPGRNVSEELLPPIFRVQGRENMFLQKMYRSKHKKYE